MHWFTGLLIGVIGIGIGINAYQAIADPSVDKRRSAAVSLVIGGLFIAGLVVYR